MTDEDIRTELLTFHAHHAQAGTFSANWRASFFMFCKRWREHQDKQAPPRVELSKAPKSEPVSSALWKPTDTDWDGAVKLYAQTGRWSAQFGPDPISRACRCPVEVLRKHSIDPKTGLKVRSDRESPLEGQAISQSAFRGQS